MRLSVTIEAVQNKLTLLVVKKSQEILPYLQTTNTSAAHQTTTLQEHNIIITMTFGRVPDTAFLWITVLLWVTAYFATASLTRSECVDSLDGIIVGDIGNGAIFQSDYRCDSNGEPPIDIILPGPNEPIATEGEVCCGSAKTLSSGSSTKYKMRME